MNVIVSNERREMLSELNIEVIKSVNGVFSADELVEMFGNFFFGRMILDITAVQNYQDAKNLQKISMSLDVEKIVVVLPENDPICLQPQFLSRMISMGIYNFTTNLDGINYLLANPNTYRDVAHLHQIDVQATVPQAAVATGSAPVVSADMQNLMVSGSSFILGVKNMSDHAGATTLIYMLRKALATFGIDNLAIEVTKRDFIYFNDKGMLSVSKQDLATELLKHRTVPVILIDLNDCEDVDVCTDVIYLLETSSLKLNRLMVRDRRVFEKMRGKKIVLSQSLLTQKDVLEFEYESKSKIFHTLPPLDERADNSEVLGELLRKLGVIQ